MKDQEIIARFIFLRAQGLSFARIASEINVSKPTLIQWSRQHQFEIHNLRAIETEALAEKFLAPRHDRWKQLGEQLRRIEEEIAKRNLDTVPTARLISLAAKLRAEVGREASPPKFSTSVRSLPKEEYFEDVLDWQV